MDSTLVAQGGLGVALAIALVGIVALWKQLLKVQGQRDEDQKLILPALQSAAEMVKAAGDEITRNRMHNEDRDRQLSDLQAEVAEYRRRQHP